MPTFKYESIADDLRSKITRGVYRPGSLLPSRRELCEEHDVSEMTVKLATGILKREGLLRLRPGVGLYVVDQAPRRRDPGE